MALADYLESLNRLKTKDFQMYAKNSKSASLILAVISGDAQTLSHLLQSLTDLNVPNIPDEFGWTPIMIAAAQGKVAIIEEFINHAAQHSDDDDVFAFKSAAAFSEALTVAAEYGQNEIVGQILAHQRISHDDAMIALKVAAENGHAGAVAKLLELEYVAISHDAAVIALKAAAQNGHAEVVAELLASKKIEFTSGNVGDVLKTAVEKKYQQIVEEIIRSPGIKPRRSDVDAALKITARNGAMDIAKLINQGLPKQDAVEDVAITVPVLDGSRDTLEESEETELESDRFEEDVDQEELKIFASGFERFSKLAKDFSNWSGAKASAAVTKLINMVRDWVAKRDEGGKKIVKGIIEPIGAAVEDINKNVGTAVEDLFKTADDRAVGTVKRGLVKIEQGVGAAKEKLSTRKQHAGMSQDDDKKLVLAAESGGAGDNLVSLGVSSAGVGAALKIVAEKGNVAFVKMLIESEKNKPSEADVGDALRLAATRGHDAVVKELKKQAPLKSVVAALRIAAKKDHSKVVDELIVSLEDREETRELIRALQDPSMKINKKTSSAVRAAACMYFAHKGSSDVVNKLLQTKRLGREDVNAALRLAKQALDTQKKLGTKSTCLRGDSLIKVVEQLSKKSQNDNKHLKKSGWRWFVGGVFVLGFAVSAGVVAGLIGGLIGGGVGLIGGGGVAIVGLVVGGGGVSKLIQARQQRSFLKNVGKQVKRKTKEVQESEKAEARAGKSPVATRVVAVEPEAPVLSAKTASIDAAMPAARSQLPDSQQSPAA
jgi:ankyrin repeat protein